MFTEVYLVPSQTSVMELFSPPLNHILKMYILNLIELPLGSIFYTTHPFVKKLTTVKILGEKFFF